MGAEPTDFEKRLKFGLVFVTRSHSEDVLVQEDFYAVVDWAYKIDPLRCISMMGVTERYLSSHKADAAGFVRRLLADLQARISMQFNRVRFSPRSLKLSFPSVYLSFLRKAAQYFAALLCPVASGEVK